MFLKILNFFERRETSLKWKLLELDKKIKKMSQKLAILAI